MSVYIILLIIILIIFIVLYRHITRNFNYWKDRSIPYVKPIAFFGNSFGFATHKESIGQFLHRIYNTTNSPYLGFFGFDQPFLLIRDPEIVKAVLIKDFEYFTDRSITSSDSYSDAGKYFLFVINNPEWRPLRSNMAPAFSTGKLKNMLALMEEVGDCLVTSLNSNANSNVMHVVGNYATDVIASCAFGISPNSLSQVSEFRQMVARICDINVGRSIQRGYCFMSPLLVDWLGFTFADVTASDYAQNLCRQILKDREASNENRGDLIDLLLKIRNKQENSENKIDEYKIIAQAAQYLFAGVETSEVTIGLAIYELSKNLKLQTRLRNEINEQLKDGKLTYDAIKNMTFLDLIIKETLRRYAVLPFLDRRCVKEYKLPGTEVTIDKGIPIYISLTGFHLDPQYFPEPEKFNPDRFSDGTLHPLANYLYMPFGIGPRSCPGEKFGLISSKIGILKIIQNFEVTATEKTNSPLQFKKRGMLIVPDDKDFHLHFKPLHSN